MSIHQILHRSEALNSYLPAVLKEYKSSHGWVIEYYALHPQTQELRRIHIKINRICQRYRTKSEMRNHALSIVNNLNAKLSGGWTPFFENEDSRMFAKLTDVCQMFLTESAKEKRENTMRSYKSFVNQLTEYCKINKAKDIYASVFNRGHAVRYMDWFYNKGSVKSATTYNNQIKMARAFFNWAKEKMYVKENPFESVSTKKKQKKTRTIIPPETRAQIKQHLEETNPNFLSVCELIYFSLIRPNEIKNLRVSDIDFERGCVKISDKIAKNHKQRIVALSKDTLERLRVMVRGVPKDYYLFGTDFHTAIVPSKTKLGNGNFTKKWERLRQKLQLPKEYQLYSFRDTGIYEMLKSGVDDLSVMQHADHSSLDITTIYANHADPKLIEKMQNANIKF